MCLIGSNNPSCPRATTQLRAWLLKVTRYLWMKELFISHKSSFSWTQAINTLLSVPRVETKKKNIAKLPASCLPRRNGVIPLIWFGASRSTAWICFGRLQQGPLLTPASPLCLHPCKHYDYCSTHEQVGELLQGNSWCSCQITKLWDDNLLLGYETRTPSTLRPDSHQGGVRTATWESPAISTCW